MEVLFRTETPVCMYSSKTSSDASMDFINSRITPTSSTHSDVIPLVAILGDPGANVLLPSTGSINGTTTILTNDEMPYLGAGGILPNTRDTRPTMNRLVIVVKVVVGHLFT